MRAGIICLKMCQWWLSASEPNQFPLNSQSPALEDCGEIEVAGVEPLWIGFVLFVILFVFLLFEMCGFWSPNRGGLRPKRRIVMITCTISSAHIDRFSRLLLAVRLLVKVVCLIVARCCSLGCRRLLSHNVDPVEVAVVALLGAHDWRCWNGWLCDQVMWNGPIEITTLEVVHALLLNAIWDTDVDAVWT
jgi:hypothetical protein